MRTLIRIEYPKTGGGLFRAQERITREDILNGSDAREGSYYDLIDNSRFDPDIYERHYSMTVASRDCPGFNSGTHYCAYRSLDELSRWMENEWIKDVIEVGFRVYMIEVSECIEGQDQAAFQLCHIISKKDISELFLK